jgi:soluble lytic murein transglycosylase-like protein
MAVVLAAALLTVTLEAYERLPVLAEPGREARAPLYSADGTPLRPALRRMEVNQAVVRLLDRGEVLAFYSGYAGSTEVSAAILDAALAAGVPVNLAFALGWQESRFDAWAVSGWNVYGTRDWGLFQLNDGSRGQWKREDFFDVRLNAEHAMQYLRECIVEMASVDLALAAYNAGIRGVREWGVPPQTRAYAASILSYERELDRAFAVRF